MWTWIPVMLRASMAPRLAEVGSFVVIGSGAAGCLIAGRYAYGFGRTVVASAAMIASGACSIAIGFLFGGPPFALLVVSAICGATGVAVSAQFSACVTEPSDP